MSILTKIQRGRQPMPPRLVLYGTEGIGKSTFAAQSPHPVFIPTEDGLSEIDCDRFPSAVSASCIASADRAALRRTVTASPKNCRSRRRRSCKPSPTINPKEPQSITDLHGFDANAVEPAGNFEPIPAGKYLAVITESEMKPTKAGTGSYLQLTFQVIGGEFQNRLLWARLNIDNPNDTARKIAQGELSAICRAVNVNRPVALTWTCRTSCAMATPLPP